MSAGLPNQQNDSLNFNSNAMHPDPITTVMNSSPSTSSTRNSGQTITELSQHLEDYIPTIPDNVVTHIMQSAGFECEDPRIVRLIAIAAQKFVSDIANDALQHNKMRSATSSSGSNKKGSKEKRYILSMDDLISATQDSPITIKKPHYFY